jgi:hypothetical protein
MVKSLGSTARVSTRMEKTSTNRWESQVKNKTKHTQTNTIHVR